MSHFAKVLKKHQAEIERMLEEQRSGTPVSYAMMQGMGVLKPFAVRLPIPLLAALDEMMEHGLWRSKQEMVHDMIQSAFQDFVDTSSEDTKMKCLQVQQRALDVWQKKAAKEAVKDVPVKNEKKSIKNRNPRGGTK